MSSGPATDEAGERGAGHGEDPAIAALGFDAALAEFQRVVAALESGGQPLEEALELYERGMRLQGHLDRLLGEAELRIQRLVERAGGAVEVRDARPEQLEREEA